MGRTVGTADGSKAALDGNEGAVFPKSVPDCFFPRTAPVKMEKRDDLWTAAALLLTVKAVAYNVSRNRSIAEQTPL